MDGRIPLVHRGQCPQWLQNTFLVLPDRCLEAQSSPRFFQSHLLATLSAKRGVACDGSRCARGVLGAALMTSWPHLERARSGSAFLNGPELLGSPMMGSPLG